MPVIHNGTTGLEEVRGALQTTLTELDGAVVGGAIDELAADECKTVMTERFERCLGDLWAPRMLGSTAIFDLGNCVRSGAQPTSVLTSGWVWDRPLAESIHG